MDDYLISAELQRAHQLIFCGMAGMVTLLHVGLLAFRPRHRENLSCAIFAASYALVVYANLEAGLVESATAGDFFVRVFFIATGIAILSWLTTLRDLLHVQPNRLLMLIAAPVVAVSLWGSILPGEIPFLAVLGLVLIAGGIALLWITQAYRRGEPGVHVLGTGMVLLAVSLIYSIMRSVGIIPANHLAIFLPAYGGGCAVISLSLLVARNFAVVSTKLEQKLVEVETLAAADLAREQEKRAFVAAKNAELESLVTARTADLREARDKSDALLYNILPREAADEIKATGHTAPRRFDDVTVIFTDFEGFTNTVSVMPAAHLVTELNEIFQQFDDIIDQHGLQKIKTIGDAYMAVGGMPEADSTAATRAVDAAVALAACIEQRNQDAAIKWRIRIGLHTGTVVAGVIGKRRLIYDIFGDTVNIASRLESSGQPGRINLSAYTYGLVRSRHPGEYLGKVSLKGKGEVDMYCLRPSHLS
jgi:class 3 adenylate cyclase